MIMRELTDAERLEVAVALLDEQGLADYAEQCKELEQTDIHR